MGFLVFYRRDNSQNRKVSLICGFVLLLSIILFLVCNFHYSLASNNTNNAQNQELINQKIAEIKNLQAEIDKYQSEIKSKQAEQKTLKNAIAVYNKQIAKNELEIKYTKLDIEKTEMEIHVANLQIAENEKSITERKQALKYLLQTLYECQQDSLLEILMSQETISGFFNSINSLESLQSQISDTVVHLRLDQEQLIEKNQELEQSQETYKSLVIVKQGQNNSLLDLKKQKDEVLKITNGEEGRYKELLAHNQTLLPSLKAELRNLQSLGSAIKFDDAISVARHIGKVTGVRPAFLLGILRVESSLGTNVGGGTYLVDMHPKQRPVFEEIVKELGYDPKTKPVSKKPTTYSGWGGAMGPAQMMPTTWRIYQAQASQISGHYPADPWNLTDAVAAMAAKLSAVEGVTSADYDSEYKAAGMYFAGSNWKRFLFYPDKVMYYTNLYEKELNS